MVVRNTKSLGVYQPHPLGNKGNLTIEGGGPLVKTGSFLVPSSVLFFVSYHKSEHL